MRRRACCDMKGMKRGAWTPEEDELLLQYIDKNNGHGSWRSLPKLAESLTSDRRVELSLLNSFAFACFAGFTCSKIKGLHRCGKSCRLRWTNYLRPDIKRGPFTPEEEKLVTQLHGMLGNRWAAIASQLPGRTDNEIKNLRNTHLKKPLLSMGIDPQTHEPCTSTNGPLTRPTVSPSTRHMAQWESARLEAASCLSKESLFLNLPSDGRTETDYFLSIWNSEVGESFRNFNKRGETETVTVCQSPISQASSSAKNGSASGITTEVGLAAAESSPATNNQNEDVEFKSSKSHADNFMASLNSSSSDDLEDSSETALQLLLDFPGSNNMSFLEGHTDNCDIFPTFLN